MGVGGVVQLDQNLAVYMVNHRSKKWWWPVFRFCVDVAVNNAFHLFKAQVHSPYSSSLDFLGFQRSIVDTYYKPYCVQNKIERMFPAARSLEDKRVRVFATTTLIIELSKGTSDDVQEVVARALLYIRVRGAVLPYIQIVLPNSTQT